MQRFHQFVFLLSLLALCWFLMMAIHELGHVIGALVTGGTVRRVVLHPLTISRTDVIPNPSPSIVVWLGPLVGCILPATSWLLIPRSWALARSSAMFFAGFCLLANGAYIAIGSFEGIGDCREMLKHGSPLWSLIVFGLVTIGLGLTFWHRLGSVKTFLSQPDLVDTKHAYTLLVLLTALIAFELFLSPR